MILSGKIISTKIKDQLKVEVDQLKKQYKRVPKLAVIIVGNNMASLTYVKNKEKGCQYIGIDSLKISLDENISETDLIEVIEELNKDNSVDGILVQLPLPKHINERKIIEKIDYLKDVDGFHPMNIANLFLGTPTMLPCTPYGIMELLHDINYDLTSKEVVVIGRSNIVGKPMALLGLMNNATVTIAHSKTKNLKEITKKADVLIVAIGKAKFIDETYLKDGVVVIDVGINKDENQKLCGDVDFESCLLKASAITPVPGGVGPMTIAMLLKNTIEAYKMRENNGI